MWRLQARHDMGAFALLGHPVANTDSCPVLALAEPYRAVVVPRHNGNLKVSRKTAADELANLVLDDSRKSLEQYLRQFARGYESIRQAESGLLWTRLQALEDQRADDYSALRKDQETLAVTAEGEFWKTRRQLGGLIELAESKGGNDEYPRLPR